MSANIIIALLGGIYDNKGVNLIVTQIKGLYGDKNSHVFSCFFFPVPLSNIVISGGHQYMCGYKDINVCVNMEWLHVVVDIKLMLKDKFHMLARYFLLTTFY